MSDELSIVSRKHVLTIPAALKALAAMERELSQAKTYAEICKVIDASKALRLLYRDIDAVKAEAEDVILAASARIGEELQRVPKAKTGPRKLSPVDGKQLSGREATGMPHTSRARYQKLAESKTELKAIANKLREQGKDATVSAVVREITQGDKKERRAEREQALASKIIALPNKKYGVIYADPAWRFEPYSPETGMDRSAGNHYPTMTTAEIAALDIASIAAPDCLLLLWATAPMLLDAHEVMTAWGFDYKSHIIWDKGRISHGYWTRNRHELLLIGTRGDIVAPAPGQQPESVIAAPVGAHSAKPLLFAELIERLYPTVPKIELFCRGEGRPNWSVWGNEAEPAKPEPATCAAACAGATLAELCGDGSLSAQDHPPPGSR